MRPVRLALLIMRPRQSTGRPGTPVIPADWSAAPRVVMAGTWRATCTITRAGAPGAYDDDLGYTPAGTASTIYTGPCRVQALDQQAQTEPAAGQDVTIGDYLVVVPHTVAALVSDVVTVTAAEDPELIGRTLTVTAATYGSESWERDLTCSLDQG